MSIDKQHILHDLYLKDCNYSSTRSTPLMFSRDSSMDTLSSFNVNFHSHNSTYTSEHSTNPSGILSPSDIPDSPPRGCDDDIDAMEQQRRSIPALNNTNSTGRTLVPRPDQFDPDEDEVDSIRNYATSPQQLTYHDDGDIDDDADDKDSIRSSISSLSLPPPPPTSTAALLANIHELRKSKHNLSVINEESLHEHRNASHDHSQMTTDDDDRRHHHPLDQTQSEEDEEDDQRGKQLLFDLIRQRLPYHPLSLTSSSSDPSQVDDRHNKSKSSSSSASSCVNDQTMREELSAHDVTIPSTMQESGYDSLLPMGSAPKRSLSNASLSTTRSIVTKKKHRSNEENDDPMQSQTHSDLIDDDDEHYDKKAGEALLRNLIAQVLPSFNPRYLNGDRDDEDEVISHPRRPSPISQAQSSSTTSSVRSLDLEIEVTKKTEKNFSFHSTHHHMTDLIQQEKIYSKRSHIHKPVHQTKSSELRRLQNQTRR